MATKNTMGFLTKDTLPRQILSLAVIGGGVIVTVLVVKQVIKYIQTLNAERQRGLMDKTVEVHGDKPFDVTESAKAIYRAFYKAGWGGTPFVEDEEAAITALLGVPDSYIPELNNTYNYLLVDAGFEGAKMNLKNDFAKYLDNDEQKAKVKAKLSLIK